MKKIFFLLVCLLLLATGCTSKVSQVHESPTFLAVVDSICEKYSTDNGYEASKVKKGMHDYISYYAANENPIFADLKFTLDGITTAEALDGSKIVTYSFTYLLEEPNDNGKTVYSLHVMVENDYTADAKIDNLKEGSEYIIIPSDGLIQYDGMLDVVGINEGRDNRLIDGRSFGTLHIKGAKFTPA